MIYLTINVVLFMFLELLYFDAWFPGTIDVPDTIRRIILLNGSSLLATMFEIPTDKLLIISVYSFGLSVTITLVIEFFTTRKTCPETYGVVHVFSSEEGFEYKGRNYPGIITIGELPGELKEKLKDVPFTKRIITREQMKAAAEFSGFLKLQGYDEWT